jgi:hypothetical protein
VPRPQKRTFLVLDGHDEIISEDFWGGGAGGGQQLKGLLAQVCCNELQGEFCKSGGGRGGSRWTTYKHGYRRVLTVGEHGDIAKGIEEKVSNSLQDFHMVAGEFTLHFRQHTLQSPNHGNIESFFKRSHCERFRALAKSGGGLFCRGGCRLGRFGLWLGIGLLRG